jgi:hypothetical protein
MRVVGLIVLSQPRFDKQTVSLAIANTRQSVLKHGLTEADRIAIGRISPLSDQGGYAVAMNYGDLVCVATCGTVKANLSRVFNSSDRISTTRRDSSSAFLCQSRGSIQRNTARSYSTRIFASPNAASCLPSPDATSGSSASFTPAIPCYVRPKNTRDLSDGVYPLAQSERNTRSLPRVLCVASTSSPAGKMDVRIVMCFCPCPVAVDQLDVENSIANR